MRCRAGQAMAARRGRRRRRCAPRCGRRMRRGLGRGGGSLKHPPPRQCHMDRISPERRSYNMSRIGGKNTAPELIVRRILHGLGFRYRLHRRDLPGTPDLVFPGRRHVIFVHGCFWHRHPDCKYARTPNSNIDFWVKKFETTTARDSRVSDDLAQLGWSATTVWECETRHPKELEKRLLRALASPGEEQK